MTLLRFPPVSLKAISVTFIDIASSINPTLKMFQVVSIAMS